MSISNVGSHYEINMLNDKAKLCEKTVPVKLLVNVIIDLKQYPSTYCLMQG